nr:hypothetical protein [Mimivirus sp.]
MSIRDIYHNDNFFQSYPDNYYHLTSKQKDKYNKFYSLNQETINNMSSQQYYSWCIHYEKFHNKYFSQYTLSIPKQKTLDQMQQEKMELDKFFSDFENQLNEFNFY